MHTVPRAWRIHTAFLDLGVKDVAEDTNRGSGTKDRVDRTSVSRLTCIFGSVEVVRAEKMECSEVVSDVNARGCATGAARRSTAPGRSRSSGYCLQIPRLPHLPGAPAACRGLLFGKVAGYRTQNSRQADGSVGAVRFHVEHRMHSVRGGRAFVARRGSQFLRRCSTWNGFWGFACSLGVSHRFCENPRFHVEHLGSNVRYAAPLWRGQAAFSLTGNQRKDS